MIIDFHAHIVPRADHGCNGTAMTFEQLKLMQKFGTDAVVATPHFYPNQDRVQSFLDRRDAAIEAMRQKLPLNELPTVFTAAEVLVCPEMHKMEDLEKLAVEGTNVILLEMPFERWNDTLIETVLGVKRRGLIPVLAHIDRYNLDEVRELLSLGIAAQLNAEAFAPFKSTKPLVGFIEAGAVVALGSDLHDAATADYRRFLRMRKKLGARADAVFAKTAELLQGATPLQREREKQLQASAT